jgi:hypothetical protein
MSTFHLKPCKEVGYIKNAIRDAILDGAIPNNYESAYAFMMEKANDIGISKST